MPTIPVTITEGEARTFIATWPNMASGDVGEPIRYAGAADRTVQVIGEFGGATVRIEGTLEQVPTTWLPLNDAQGNPTEITQPRLEALTELVRQVRPAVVGGAGTDVTVMLLMRQTI
jgi:hypothetical protein